MTTMHELAWRAGEGETGGGRVLRSPGVGRLVELPPLGALLQPGALAGTLRVLRRDVRLLLPDDAGGVVAERLVPPGRPAVEFDQAVLRLVTSLDAAAGTMNAPAGARAGATALDAATLVVRAPTDGVFYRGPGPGLEPYVREGGAVERGTVMGLIEIMKSFHQLVYGRDDALPARAVIRRVLPADASEVRQGDVLFHVESAP